MEQLALLEADVVVQELAEGMHALDGVQALGSGAELLVLLPDALRQPVLLLVALERGQHQLFFDLEVSPAALAPELTEAFDRVLQVLGCGATQTKRHLQGLVVIVPKWHESR